MATLYLVGTPIGNLEDISFRALDVLKQVPLIAAEDTRTTRQLLTHFDIHTPVTSFFEHSREAKLHRLLSALDTGDVAVVSEAGMPGINDPGEALVHAAIGRGHRVSPIPGASAVLAALVASGLPCQSFYYLGFLPREPQARRRVVREVASERDTLVAFETPHRLRRALADMEELLGAERPVCVARELTKVFEEFQRGTLAAVRAHFEQTEPRGEFTLVIDGYAGAGRAVKKDWDAGRVRREFRQLVSKGTARTDAVKQIARVSGWDRRRVYEATVKGTKEE